MLSVVSVVVGRARSLVVADVASSPPARVEELTPVAQSVRLKSQPRVATAQSGESRKDGGREESKQTLV